MSTGLGIILVLIYLQARAARKAAESGHPPPQRERKPWFTPRAPWWQHVGQAIAILTAFAIALVIAVAALGFVLLLLL